jgi:hypothetical protein
MEKGLAGVVPWSLQLIFRAGDITAWGAIKTDNPRDAPGSHTLKHGPSLGGKWYMLGVVDGNPDETSDIFKGVPDAIQPIISVATAIKDSFGRPDNLIGITPLLIFRKIVS